ncbi:zinc transporter ZIP12-like isoform X2 [Stylophora pistillata]|uniref:zinc transporter ZIP12-like isoform X2 n=1 Tax=Stylophora pistillata TaxID=50429 RepID=UPI000C0412BC|nr:zinc transporter ZIP12-like isoform X2 [Stylophora pistillata]
MVSKKLTLLLCLYFSLRFFVRSHELPKQKHEHYSFTALQETLNGEVLLSDDVDRLLSKLHFWNCSDSSAGIDKRKCLSTSYVFSYAGSSVTQLNSSEFVEISPMIVYCLVPAPEKNPGRCSAPKNHSELYSLFARNFSHHGDEGNITHETLGEILKEINSTIGKHLTTKKCFSAEDIVKEIEEEEEGHHEEDGHHGEEEGHHHEEEEKPLHLEDFQKACASIVLHLVQGYCIEEAHGHNETSSLPSREFFIKELFENKTHLSEGDLEAIMKVLKIGKAESSSGEDAHDHDDGHKHRRRRSAGSLLSTSLGSKTPHSVHRRAVDEHGHGHGTGTGTCYSLDDMLTVFDIDHTIGADQFDFKELCPAFIQQAKSGHCNEAHKDTPETEKDMGKIWGYGFLAVTIISLTSLAGVATIPFFGKRMYKKILATLVALAVGTLAGDSLLHLLPHAFGLHAHEEEGAGHEGHEEEDNGFVWKALVVLASIYAFFLFETLMHLCLKSKVGEHSHSHVEVELPGPSSRHMSFKKNRKCSRLEHREGAPPIANHHDEVPPMDNGGIVLTNVEGPTAYYNSSPSCTFRSHSVYEHVSSSDTEGGDYQNANGEVKGDGAAAPQDVSSKPKKSLKSSLSRRSVFSDEDGIKKPMKKISAVAWMIIIGDTLHNISDGLAIGAAFSDGGNSGVSGGISTSIAVFCHELPHELGDFAVLLTAGMSVKMALVANLLSACSCYIGLAIGIYVGQQADVRFWIFAIAGGMFLYVALVDMLPDLMHSESLQTEPLVTFICQNFGLLLGIAIMLVIALYEEDLMAVTW